MRMMIILLPFHYAFSAMAVPAHSSTPLHTIAQRRARQGCDHPSNLTQNAIRMSAVVSNDSHLYQQCPLLTCCLLLLCVALCFFLVATFRVVSAVWWTASGVVATHPRPTGYYRTTPLSPLCK